MDWRKQIQEHIRDAETVATSLVIALSADTNSARERALACLPGRDVDAGFDRIEQRIANARGIWNVHRA